MKGFVEKSHLYDLVKLALTKSIIFSSQQTKTKRNEKYFEVIFIQYFLPR